ncbi:MAG: hypothetical protein AAGG07_07255 [Planctomycetota bacterium]
MHRALFCTLLLAGTASPALAQVVTPPPAPRPATPEYVRPATPSPAPRPARAERQQDPARAAQQRLEQVDLSGFDVPSIVERDDSGALIPLDGATDLAALEANTLIGADQREDIDAYLHRRRASVARSVAQHADVLHDLDGGMLEQISGTATGEVAQASLNTVMQRLNPVLSTGSLPREMYTEGLLSAEQAAAGEQMAQEYRAAVLEQVRADFLPEIDSDVTLVDMVIRSALEERGREALGLYRDMLVFSSDDLLANLTAIGVEGKTLDSLRAQVRGAVGTDDRQERLSIMRDVMTLLDGEQRTALLMRAADGVAPMPAAE